MQYLEPGEQCRGPELRPVVSQRIGTTEELAQFMGIPAHLVQGDNSNPNYSGRRQVGGGQHDDGLVL